MITEKNVFLGEKYQIIGKLILHAQTKNNGIETKFLKFALVKPKKPYTDHAIDYYSKFFFNDKNKKMLSWLKEGLESNKISEKEYTIGIKKFEKTQFITSRIFETEVNLKKHLQTLRRLKLIESIKPETGFSHWAFTDRGLNIYLRHINRKYLDLLEDTNNLIYINHVLTDLVLLEKEKKQIQIFKNKTESNKISNGHGLS